MSKCDKKLVHDFAVDLSQKNIYEGGDSGGSRIPPMIS